MTRDDLIRMAREAGVFFSVPDVCPAEPLEHHVQAVQRFAALVAAHEWNKAKSLPAVVQMPQADHAFLKRVLAAMEGVIDVADRKTVEFDALRECVVDLTLMLHAAPEAPAQQR